MGDLRLRMTAPQAEFFQLTDRYPLFVGGYGSGKTETLVNCAVRDALEAPGTKRKPGLIGLYEPTYDLVRLILAPRLEEKLEAGRIPYRYNKQENVFRTGPGCANFVLRTLDNPARIVGYQTYRAHVDELDTLKRDHAEEAWRKIIARNRQRPVGVAKGAQNRVSAYTTPEGFRFCHEQWVKRGKRADGYYYLRAPTSSNPFLDEDYEASLRATYPPQLVKAYLEGLFVNMTQGSVYPDFDRKANHAPTTLLAGEPLHVGMDFNVLKMAAIVFVERGGAPHAVGELVRVRDTPTMARLLKERYPGHAITVYPDPAGQHTSSQSASVSDLQILRAAGFELRGVKASTTDGLATIPVKDRVNAVNALILNGAGDRRLKVNTDACPTYTDCLEQQPYDEHGEPDKEGDFDHPNDAGGYFMNFRWPVVKPVATRRAHISHGAR